MPKDIEPDDIPTLNDLLLSGDGAGDDAAAGPETESGEPANPRSRSPLELRLEAMIGDILNRHMASAREEVTRSVLEEMRRHLEKE